MRNPYDVHVEFVKEEVVTIDADNSDDAIAEAYEWQRNAPTMEKKSVLWQLR